MSAVRDYWGKTCVAQRFWKSQKNVKQGCVRISSPDPLKILSNEKCTKQTKNSPTQPKHVVRFHFEIESMKLHFYILMVYHNRIQ